MKPGIQLFTDSVNAADLAAANRVSSPLLGYLKAHLVGRQQETTKALLAYIEMNDPHQEQLQNDPATISAVAGGSLPRVWASLFALSWTGLQGRTDHGVFLQITGDDAVDLPVPGQHTAFGVVKAAQARGDFRVLVDRKRRALRVHLSSDVSGGLALLQTVIPTSALVVHRSSFESSSRF